MEKITTRIFKYASLAFGVIGILLVLTVDPEKGPKLLLVRFLFITVFIILPSFALSVASKYLGSK